MVFGAATIVFGLSTSFALFARRPRRSRRVGRGQRGHPGLARPDPDAGRDARRVSAVHSLFTGTSNQLGAFESGLVAALLGTVPSVLLGGIGTVAIAVLWMVLFPELRRVHRLKNDARRRGVGRRAGCGRGREDTRHACAAS